MMFVNKLDVNVEDRISHFVDAMNVGGVVDSREDCPRLQQDMDQVENWPSTARCNLIPTSAR